MVLLVTLRMTETSRYKGRVLVFLWLSLNGRKKTRGDGSVFVFVFGRKQGKEVVCMHVVRMEKAKRNGCVCVLCISRKQGKELIDCLCRVHACKR